MSSDMGLHHSTVHSSGRQFRSTRLISISDGAGRCIRFLRLNRVFVLQREDVRNLVFWRRKRDTSVPFNFGMLLCVKNGQVHNCQS